jgi:citrate lyase subunit beta/citryl-CoA lyase
MVRSALFVPASSERFVRNAEHCAADAVILDLEDSVVDGARSRARRLAREFIASRPPQGEPAVFVRINPLAAEQLDEDLDAVVHPALDAVLLPKIEDPADVVELDRKLAWYEGSRNLAHGTIRIWPLLETAPAITLVGEIATASTRVTYLGGAIADGGDLARSLRLESHPEGLETLYLRSRILVAARAAGIENPMTGLFVDIDDLQGLEEFAIHSRRLGYEGMMVIHPKHVPIVNRVFSPSAEAVDDARNVLEALEAADRDGTGAARLGGRMIDVAMAKTARTVIDRDERARSLSARLESNGQ